MKITITIENDLGEQIGYATSNTIEMAVQELYRFERNYEKEIVMEENRLTQSHD